MYENGFLVTSPQIWGICISKRMEAPEKLADKYRLQAVGRMATSTSDQSLPISIRGRKKLAKT